MAAIVKHFNEHLNEERLTLIKPFLFNLNFSIKESIINRISMHSIRNKGPRTITIGNPHIPSESDGSRQLPCPIKFIPHPQCPAIHSLSNLHSSLFSKPNILSDADILEENLISFSSSLIKEQTLLSFLQ